MWNGSIQLPIRKEVLKNENGFEEERYIFSEGIPANVTDTTRSVSYTHLDVYKRQVIRSNILLEK